MRLKQLDVLRALAVLLVLGHHLEPWPTTLPLPARWLLDAWQRCGWIGVDLFFVLSGFLVSGLLFREHRDHGRIRLGRFLVRRGLKIYPGFYGLLLVSLLVRAVRGHPLQPRAFLCEALFVQNYGPCVWFHTWSLAVEEHFYLLLGLLLVALAATRGPEPFRPLPRIFAVTAPLVLALRLLTASRLPFRGMAHLFPTHLRIDSLFFGVLLSYYWHFEARRFSGYRAARWLALALGFLLVSPAVWLPVDRFFMHTVGLTCLYLGFGLILLFALSGRPSDPRPRGLVVSGLAFLGSRSYSIYLWHFPWKYWMHALIRRMHNGRDLPYFWELGIYCLGSIVLGVALAALIEVPILRIRDRYFPSRSGREIVAPSHGASAIPGRGPTAARAGRAPSAEQPV